MAKILSNFGYADIFLISKYYRAHLCGKAEQSMHLHDKTSNEESSWPKQPVWKPFCTDSWCMLLAYYNMPTLTISYRRTSQERSCGSFISLTLEKPTTLLQ